MSNSFRHAYKLVYRIPMGSATNLQRLFVLTRQRRLLNNQQRSSEGIFEFFLGEAREPRGEIYLCLSGEGDKLLHTLTNYFLYQGILLCVKY